VVDFGFFDLVRGRDQQTPRLHKLKVVQAIGGGIVTIVAACVVRLFPQAKGLLISPETI
jgi:hypothetical protein